MATTTIPLADHQLQALLQLAFHWDVSPSEVLDRVLLEALARHTGT